MLYQWIRNYPGTKLTLSYDESAFILNLMIYSLLFELSGQCYAANLHSLQFCIPNSRRNGNSYITLGCRIYGESHNALNKPKNDSLPQEYNKGKGSHLSKQDGESLLCSPRRLSWHVLAVIPAWIKLAGRDLKLSVLSQQSKGELKTLKNLCLLLLVHGSICSSCIVC